MAQVDVGPDHSTHTAPLADAPSPAALTTAIYRASGVRMNTLPLSPARILAAMLEKTLTPAIKTPSRIGLVRVA
jgi:hypothetical protein